MTGTEPDTRISYHQWYYAAIEHSKDPCGRCGHKRGNHAYFALIGDNSGGCGNRACPCDMYEEKKS